MQEEEAVQADGVLILGSVKLCMSAHWVSSLLEVPSFAPAVSFLFKKIKTRFLHRHSRGTLFVLGET